MAKKKNYEFHEREKTPSHDTDGLRRRRLKEESRWKFNPNAIPEDEDGDPDDDYGDEDYA